MALGLFTTWFILVGFLVGLETSSPGISGDIIRAGVMMSYSIGHNLPLQLCQARRTALGEDPTLCAPWDP